MKAPALALAALLVLSSAACGGEETSSPPEEGSAASEETTASPSEGMTASPSEGMSASPSEGMSASPSEGGAAGGDQPASATVLSASVGTPDDPDAYVISLVDADGEEVTELPAGDYVVEVDDPSAIHNVHLLGPGVEETTTVPETTTARWEITLEPGDYEYRCDPHPNMVGELTVT